MRYLKRITADTSQIRRDSSDKLCVGILIKVYILVGSFSELTFEGELAGIQTSKLFLFILGLVFTDIVKKEVPQLLMPIITSSRVL